LLERVVALMEQSARLRRESRALVCDSRMLPERARDLCAEMERVYVESARVIRTCRGTSD
jgi:hypothetical protein